MTAEQKCLRAETGRILTELSHELPPHIMRRLDRALAAERAHADAEVERLTKLLADCYRASGADPDDNEDWRLAGHAVEEVKRLRAENDELRNEFATASDLAASRMHTCPRCGFRAALKGETP